MRIITNILGWRLGVAAVSALIGAALGSIATAYQGHMWNALDDLQAARSQLVQASANKVATAITPSI
jgi:hypothetical protein